MPFYYNDNAFYRVTTVFFRGDDAIDIPSFFQNTEDGFKEAMDHYTNTIEGAIDELTEAEILNVSMHLITLKTQIDTLGLISRSNYTDQCIPLRSWSKERDSIWEIHVNNRRAKRSF